MTGRVILLHYSPPGVVGGVEHIMYEHVRLLRNRGIEVLVVAGRPGEDVCVIPDVDSADPGNVVIEGELDRGVVSPRFYRRRDAILAALRSILRPGDLLVAHNAFTLHFNLPLTAALWELSAHASGVRFAAWCHDLSWVNPLYLPDMRPGYPWDLLRLPAPDVSYVAISEERAAEMTSLWGESGDVRVIPNGIDVASFLRLSEQARDLVARYRLLDRGLVILLPVRVTRRKNIEWAIRAVGALRDRGVDVLFVVSGPQAPHHPGRSDAYLAELKALCADLELADHVVFLSDALGRTLDLSVVHELYLLADVLLLPSSQEGFGLPLLEAGLARLPAVVSDIPIFREVGGDAVRTVPPGAEADRMAEAILGAVSDASPRLRRRVLDRYRWDVIADSQLVPFVHEGDRRVHRR
ncbi:MAG TPA: glycosyltransferase family 4 protein [Chloroflexota bacterium]|nr:glycosyltransferase family 4 protein [Chloroflexota bacterium]